MEWTFEWHYDCTAPITVKTDEWIVATIWCHNFDSAFREHIILTNSWLATVYNPISWIQLDIERAIKKVVKAVTDDT